MRYLIAISMLCVLSGCPIDPTVNVGQVNVDAPVQVENPTDMTAEPKAQPSVRTVAPVVEDAGVDMPSTEPSTEEDAGNPAVVETEDAGAVEADAGTPVEADAGLVQVEADAGAPVETDAG